MKQQIFKFEERHDYLPENFLVSGSNQAAFSAVINIAGILNIYGAKSSGKTYLAHIAASYNKLQIIEDLDTNYNEQELFHLLNSTRENSRLLLITSVVPVKTLGFKLPDLTSRLATITSVGIEAPDDQLIYMLFARLFATRQLKVTDDVINFLAARSPRNFEGVKEIVQKIDGLSLSEKRSITTKLIKKIL